MTCEGRLFKSQFQDDEAMLDFDDLHDPEASNGIILEMQDRQRYFEGRMSSQVENGHQVCEIFVYEGSR